MQLAEAVRDACESNASVAFEGTSDQYVEIDLDLDAIVSRFVSEPAPDVQAQCDGEGEDWLDKLVREGGGSVEFFSRQQLDAAVAAEREACALECEEVARKWAEPQADAARNCAGEIRDRSGGQAVR
jgi:hypothetical protein